MRVNLTEEEAEYLRDRPFWDWQQQRLENNRIRFLAGNRNGQGTQTMIRKEKFYYGLYRKLGGEIKRKER